MGFMQNLGQGFSNFIQGVGSTVGGVLSSVVGGVLNPVAQSGIVNQVANSSMGSAFGSALGSSIVPTGALGGITPNTGANMMDQMQSMIGQFIGSQAQQAQQSQQNQYSGAQPKGNAPIGGGGEQVKWYKQKWFMPTAISAGVVALFTTLYLIFKPKKNRL